MHAQSDSSPYFLVDGQLCKAALKGDGQAVDSLVRQDGSIRAAISLNLVTMVAERGYLDVAAALLDAGADVNGAFPQTKMTALMQAAKNGHLTLAQLLVERGANIYAITASGIDALMLAARYGQTECVRFLLEQGMNVLARCDGGETALMRAAASGHLNVVEALLAAGADLRAVSNSGMTALRYAERHDRRMVVVRLRRAAVQEAREHKFRRIRAIISTLADRWNGALSAVKSRPIRKEKTSGKANANLDIAREDL